MKKVYSVIFLPFLIILILVNPVIGSDDWMENWTDENGDVILYKIEQRIKNTVQVWGERTFSDEGRKEFIQDRKDRGLSTEGWDKIGHIMSLYEINCQMNTGRLLSTVVYDTGGKIIYSDSFGEPQWEYIIPDSVGYKFQEKVCQ